MPGSGRWTGALRFPSAAPWRRSAAGASCSSQCLRTRRRSLPTLWRSWSPRTSLPSWIRQRGAKRQAQVQQMGRQHLGSSGALRAGSPISLSWYRQVCAQLLSWNQSYLMLLHAIFAIHQDKGKICSMQGRSYEPLLSVAVRANLRSLFLSHSMLLQTLGCCRCGMTYGAS